MKMDLSHVIKVKRVGEGNTVPFPVRSSENSAAFDFFCPSDVLIKPRELRVITTGFTMIFPPNIYGRLASRSSLALKGLGVLGGVIDPDFRGVIAAIVINFSDRDIFINQNDRFVQLVPEFFSSSKIQECSEIKTNEETARGDGGFGSTGV